MTVMSYTSPKQRTLDIVIPCYTLLYYLAERKVASTPWPDLQLPLAVRHSRLLRQVHIGGVSTDIRRGLVDLRQSCTQ